MSKLTLTMHLSLDGVIQAPGGPDEDTSDGFEQGGWLVPHADEDMGGIMDGIFAQADGFLLGRKTYEIFAGYWPGVTDPSDRVAAALNSLPKYVVSRTLARAEWNNSTLIKSDLIAEVGRLKRLPVREIQMHGSGTLAQTLMYNELIDEYRLLFYPVVLGKGRRLFNPGGAPSTFKLVDSRTTGKGMLFNTYRWAGKPSYGSMV
jgi:dihydrofolate reductase